jgi:hypothetical protein
MHVQFRVSTLYDKRDVHCTAHGFSTKKGGRGEVVEGVKCVDGGGGGVPLRV